MGVSLDKLVAVLPQKWLPRLKFALPFLIAFAVIATLYLTLDYGTFATLSGAMTAYFLPPLGKESIIPLTVAKIRGTTPFAPALVALAIAFVDIIIGLFLVWNFDLARKLPVIGKYIRMVESKGEGILQKHRWVRKLAFTGIVLFVMIPFQGSGAVGASIVGRVIGLNPWRIWASIIIGAVGGCLAIAYFTDLAVYLLTENLFIGMLLITVLLIFIEVVYSYKKYWGANNGAR